MTVHLLVNHWLTDGWTARKSLVDGSLVLAVPPTQGALRSGLPAVRELSGRLDRWLVSELPAVDQELPRG